MADKLSPFDLVGHLPHIIGDHPAAVRRRVEAMEKLMEGLYVVPFIKRRIGLDVILDLIPIGGDVAGLVMGGYMIWEARNLGMSKFTMVRMAGRVGLNALIGAIPFIGAGATMFYRSNTYNLRTIIKHLDRHHPETAVIEG